MHATYKRLPYGVTSRLILGSLFMLGEKLENWGNPPTGSYREASRLGEKLENRGNPPTGSDMYPEFWTHIYELG